jgi:hypothetical protein
MIGAVELLGGFNGNDFTDGFHYAY